MEGELKTIFDDRAESPGVKFNDADLVGIPVRVVTSNRNLQKNSVEVKKRSDQDPEIIPWNETVDYIKTILKK
jgi:prolyl-tRNA synthetase